MSYSISMRVRVHNTNCYLSLPITDANTTWNLKQMIQKSTGLEWKNNQDNGYAYRIIPKIQKGLNELTTRPEKYKQYEAENGWGTVEHCKNFFTWILKDWNEFVVNNDHEIVKRVKFWII